MSAATRPGGPGQVLAGLLLAGVVLWLLVPFAGVDPPERLTVSNAPWTDEGFNLANARERALTGQFATGDVDRSLTNGAYSALAAATFAVTGPSLAAGRARASCSSTTCPAPPCRRLGRRLTTIPGRLVPAVGRSRCLLTRPSPRSSW